MSIYTDASLIVTPNSYKAGTLYSLKGADLGVVRATTATYVGSDGLIKTALANEVRFDYTNGSCPSILVEPQRTNLLTNSDGNLSTYTTNSNVTDATTPINGFANSIQFGDNSLNRLAYKRNFTPTIAIQYVLSAFIQMDDNSQPILGSIATEGDFSFILNGLRGNINPQVVKIGNTNIYKVSVSFIATTTNTQFGVTKYTTQSSKGFKITGIQLEAGANATSYIPTVASSVTRNADVISKSGISSLIGQTEGTIFCDVNLTFLNTSINRSIINLFVNDADFNNVIRFRVSGANFSYDIRNSGVIQSSINLIVPSIGRYKLAIIYKNNYAAFFINGIKIGEDLSVSIPSGLQLIRLGSFNSAGGENFSDYINSALVLPIALTDQECIDLTTL